MKIIELFVAKDGRFFDDQDECLAYEKNLSGGESPYIYKGFNSKDFQEKAYNPKYNDDAKCECGHAYYRHFDSHENNAPVGCKYCGCFHFNLATDTKEKDKHHCCENH